MSKMNVVGEAVSDLKKLFEWFRRRLSVCLLRVTLLSSHAFFPSLGLQKLSFPFSWRNEDPEIGC